MFEDLQSGLIFSFTIEKNFSKKNVIEFIKTKFKIFSITTHGG